MRNKTMEHEVLLEKKEHRKICEDCQLRLQLLEARYEGQLEYDKMFKKEFSNQEIEYELVTNQFFQIHNMEFEVDTLLIFPSKLVVSTIIKYPEEAICSKGSWYLNGINITGSPFEEHEIAMTGIKYMTKVLGEEVEIEGVVVLMNEAGTLPGKYYQSVYQ